MTGIGRTLTNLARYRKRLATLGALSAVGQRPGPRGVDRSGRLLEVTGFGSNPGALRMFVHIPAKLPPKPALVVVLHGCTQTANGYDHGSGWSKQADRNGFVVVFAEQKQGNNPNICFTWFQPGDTTRDHGEVLSIRQMIARAVADHAVDPARIYITGLSAGGAMTAAMLAAYPEVFAGGGIVAGLPHGAATTAAEAFAAMFQGRTLTARARGDAVRAASTHKGPWPRVSIWHGEADTTVKPMNAGELVKQWTDVHGIAAKKPVQSIVDGVRHRVWTSRAGQVLVEEYLVPGLGHGTPVHPKARPATGEHAGAFFIDAGISATARLVQSWGLAAAPARATSRKMLAAPGPVAPASSMSPARTVAAPAAGTDARPKTAPARASGKTQRPAKVALPALLPTILPQRAPAKPVRPAQGFSGAKAGKAPSSRFAMIEGIITRALKTAGLIKR